MTVFALVPSLLLAQAAATPNAGSGLAGLVPFFFLAVIFYFIIFRPQQKKAKEQAALVSSLKTGDQVVTSSGFHGMISNVKEKTVIVKFAENVKIEVDKASVSGVVRGESDVKALAS